ncbi:A/G-specific adenine glycosylase [Deinococcus sp.]|uniref:A/G-specific adenine glycosylase n=1 Tax=Deinococcus sp. TaxID=47478 RepID=UPI0025FBF42A|nr:A/G-specific adenine glycosylase [Deinococcus sp.]
MPPDLHALRADLLGWFDLHARELPWRVVNEHGLRDPYRVWISEVLLQQTQVARGLLYFERFLTAFPDVQALAAATTEAVLKAWEGCGYYARARNLHAAAQIVAQTGFPTSYDGWLALSGVGPYTAAAISSLAFGEARAVNDGNVRRVLARVYAEVQPGPAWVQTQADQLLDPQRPGDWNEAVMDLGATICTPKSPNCGACPVSGHCQAYQSGNPGAYPAPKVRPTVRQVQAVALLIGDAHSAYLEQRRGSLLGGLYGLPVEEVDGTVQLALGRLTKRLGAHSPKLLGTVTHQMTHRHLTLHVYAAHSELAPQDVSRRPLSRLDHKALALLSGPGQLFETA